MKLYVNLARAVVNALHEIFEDHRYADKVIEKTLKQNSKWGARDRRFIAETTYDIVRWYRLLQNITEASEYDFWKMLGGWCILSDIQLPDWQEFKDLNEAKIKQRYDKMTSIRKFKESIPDWIDELGEKELGKVWDNELTALNEEAHVVLRANTLKVSANELAEILEDDEVGTSRVDGLSDALVLDQRQNVFRLPAFKEGLFEVQDASSQHIAPFLQVEPGMRVIDACAGAGGKALHIASIMQNRGRIIAMDIEGWKLDELKKRARRAGASTIETRIIESSKTIKRLENSCDRLLLDVPCSGLGVLRRNPDAKWKLSPEFLDEVRKSQQEIIHNYSHMVKPGGIMVYGTCSILPSENENQVKEFLASPDRSFELIDEKRLWPSEGFDGFYMAALKRLK